MISGRYVVDMWSICGRYGVGMWSVCGQYVVYKGGRYVVGEGDRSLKIKGCELKVYQPDGTPGRKG